MRDQLRTPIKPRKILMPLHEIIGGTCLVLGTVLFTILIYVATTPIN